MHNLDLHYSAKQDSIRKVDLQKVSTLSEDSNFKALRRDVDLGIVEQATEILDREQGGLGAF